MGQGSGVTGSGIHRGNFLILWFDAFEGAWFFGTRHESRAIATRIAKKALQEPNGYNGYVIVPFDSICLIGDITKTRRKR